MCDLLPCSAPCHTVACRTDCQRSMGTATFAPACYRPCSVAWDASTGSMLFVRLVVHKQVHATTWHELSPGPGQAVRPHPHPCGVASAAFLRTHHSRPLPNPGPGHRAPVGTALCNRCQIA